MISVTFTSDIENITCNTHVYQWDNKRTLEIKGLTFDDTPAVHFANKMSKQAFAVEPTIANGVMIADIPNSLLCEPHHITAYVYSVDDNQCKTVKTIFIPLEKRPKPADYVFEGNEGIFTLAEINAKVEDLIAETNAHYDAYVQAKNVELNGFMNDKTTQINNFIASQNADREAYQNSLDAQMESFQNNVASSHNHNNLYYGKSEVDTKLSEKANISDFGTISEHYVWEKYKDETMCIPAYANKTQFYLYSSKYKSYTFGKNFTMSANGTYTVTETFTPSKTPVNSNHSYWIGIFPFYFKDDTGVMYRATGWYTGYDNHIMINVNKMTAKSVTSKVNYGYVSSNLPNAYPISDGFNYEPLGRFGGIGHSVTGAIVYDSVFTSEYDVVLGFRPKAVFVEDISGIRQFSSNTDKYGGFTIDGYSQIYSYISSETPYTVEFLKITDYGFQMKNYAVSGTTGYRYKYYIAFR